MAKKRKQLGPNEEIRRLVCQSNGELADLGSTGLLRGRDLEVFVERLTANLSGPPVTLERLSAIRGCPVVRGEDGRWECGIRELRDWLIGRIDERMRTYVETCKRERLVTQVECQLPLHAHYVKQIGEPTFTADPGSAFMRLTRPVGTRLRFSAIFDEDQVVGNPYRSERLRNPRGGPSTRLA